VDATTIDCAQTDAAATNAIKIIAACAYFTGARGLNGLINFISFTPILL
jgi:hypothetical protein